MRIVFKHHGDLSQYLGNGWSRPERQHAWAIGEESWLLLPATGLRHTCLLSFLVFPHIQRGALDRQRVAISVNGHDIGEFSVTGRQTIVAIVPGVAVAGKAAMCIRLHHPDCARPIDFPQTAHPDHRVLAVAYQELIIDELSADAECMAAAIRLGLQTAAAQPRLHMAPPDTTKADTAAVLARLQSAGDDCEFGFVQRHFGVEALGLFRFASISISNLTQGILREFADIAAPEQFEIIRYENAPAHDYMGHERTYGMRYHTLRLPAQVEAAVLQAHEVKRLRLLARKFMEDVALGEHMFVVKRKQPLLLEEVAALLAALRQHGPAWLLWVREADALHPPGSAEHVTTGLIAGYVEQIDVSPLQNIRTVSWGQLCRSAFAVWQVEQAPAERVGEA